MRSVDSKALRGSGWGDTLQNVRDGEARAVLQRGRPEAVLLPFSLWQRGAAAVPVDESVQQTDSVRHVRDNLRTRREEARRGRHTMITWHSDTDPLVVLAPWEWTREALPELGDLEIDDSTPRRYGGTSAGA
ncbi:hypothetical protein [Nocardia salmonicida]|uniref:hypothetical protein n=1 Tax=Nocardia salmonicida TaxID=53431 RepID=UPI003404EBF0